MNNIDKALSGVTKKGIDGLMTPMVGIHTNGISIKLKSGGSLVYTRSVEISCSNGRYVIDDGFMVETLPVEDMEDFEVFE